MTSTQAEALLGQWHKASVITADKTPWRDPSWAENSEVVWVQDAWSVPTRHLYLLPNSSLSRGIIILYCSDRDTRRPQRGQRRKAGRTGGAMCRERWEVTLQGALHKDREVPGENVTPSKPVPQPATLWPWASSVVKWVTHFCLTCCTGKDESWQWICKQFVTLKHPYSYKWLFSIIQFVFLNLVECLISASPYTEIFDRYHHGHHGVIIPIYWALTMCQAVQRILSTLFNLFLTYEIYNYISPFIMCVPSAQGKNQGSDTSKMACLDS